MDVLGAETQDILDGRYQIEHKLGQGGMGAVYRATHLESGMPVALKVVLPHAGRPRLTPRFLREARLAARLRHPHVVQIYDFGRWGDERSQYFLAMELIEGLSFATLLEGGVDFSTIAALLGQVLEALAHVHARDVLHRDIKPDNILVRRREDGRLVAKLTDFGLAAALLDDDEITRLTEAGSILGTPAYMAPEQFEGRGMGPPSDLYPVGAILYQAAWGRLPFEGSLHQLLAAKMSNELPAFPEAAEPELRELLAKFLARRPESRYALAAEAREALRAFEGEALLDEATWRSLVEQSDRAPVTWGAEQTLSVRSGSMVARRRELGVLDEDFWGRDAELEAFEGWAREVETGAGRVVLLSGDAGLGKSALVRELGVRWHEAGRFSILRAACRAEGGIVGALARALEHMLSTVGRPRVAVGEAVRAQLARYDDVDEDEVRALVSLIRPELGSGEHRATRQQKFAVMVRLLRRMARTRPVLLVLDDLHAVGADGAAFVDLLVHELGFEAFACMLIAAHRPSVELERALARGASGPGRQRLHLEPLEVRLLARELAATRALSSEMAHYVAERSGGNPLFALHLASAAEQLDTESVSRSRLGHHSTLSDSLLPDTLRSLLEASLSERLEQTPEPDRARKLVEQIAVLGERVEVELLESFLGDDALDALDDDLDALIACGVLRDAERGLEIAFTNGLLRDTLLANLGPRKARRMHRRAASLREARERPEEAGVVGDHHAEAGQMEDAATWWLKAQRHEARAGNTIQSATYGRKALDVLGAEDVRRAGCAVELGRVLRAVGHLEDAVEVLEPVLEGSDVEQAMLAAELLGEIFQEQQDDEAWGALMTQIRGRVDEAATPTGRAAYLRTYAFFQNMRGASNKALPAAREAFELLPPEGEEAVRAAARWTWACIHLGRADEALSAAERAMAAAGERLDLRAEALRLLTIAYNQAQRTDDMLRAAREGLEMQRRLGHLARAVTYANDLSMYLLMAERYEEAAAQAQEVVRQAKELELPMETMRAVTMVGVSYLLQGRAEEALSVLRDNVVSRHASLGPLYDMSLGWACVQNNHLDEAALVFARVPVDVNTSAMRGMTTLMEGIVEDLMQHREHAGLRAQAVRFLEFAMSRWERRGEVERVARSRAWLGSLSEALPG